MPRKTSGTGVTAETSIYSAGIADRNHYKLLLQEETMLIGGNQPSVRPIGYYWEVKGYGYPSPFSKARVFMLSYMTGEIDGSMDRQNLIYLLIPMKTFLIYCCSMNESGPAPGGMTYYTQAYKYQNESSFLVFSDNNDNALGDSRAIWEVKGFLVRYAIFKGCVIL